MKKSSLVLGILVLVFGLVFFMGTKGVMAADDFETLIVSENEANSTPSSTTKSSSGNGTAENVSNKNSNVTNKNSNVTNSNSNKTNTNATNSNNVSNYNNTNTPNSLSKAGIEDSIPTMVLIVIFAISAIYAFKKINDYKNV